MSRYKLRFVPQGAFPPDLNMGIHMTPGPPPVEPVVVVPAVCVPSCTGWGVTINDAPSTGNVHHFLDAAFVAIVAPLDGVELCGGCLEWELRKLSVESEDVQMYDITVTPNACDGATVEGFAATSYEGLWFGLYPTLNGQPFCLPIIFRSFTDCVTIIGPGATNTWFEITLQGALPLGPTYDGSGIVPSSSPPDLPTLQISGDMICPGDTVDFSITQDTGTLGNGEQIVNITPLPSGQWQLQFSTLFDLSGSAFTVTPIVNGVPYTEQNITFTCTV